jgi:Leucine Rich repeat
MLASSGRFTRLQTLRLSGNDAPFGDEGVDPYHWITEAGLVALAGNPSLANLRQLDVSWMDVTASGIDALLNGSHWRLTGLGLAGNAPEEVIRVIARSARLARLTRLDLSNNYRGLNNDALLPLAESEYLSPLCELNIAGCNPDPEVRDALRVRLGRRLRE